MRRIVCVDHRKRRVVWESGIIIIEDKYINIYIINYPQGRFIVTVTSPVMVGERDGKHGVGKTPQKNHARNPSHGGFAGKSWKSRNFPGKEILLHHINRN